MNRETFVRVYVELRRAARAAPDSANFAERKRKILSRHEIAPADLRTFIDEHAGQVGYLAAVWDSINAKLTNAAEDSVRG